jgi:hypothetical protein
MTLWSDPGDDIHQPDDSTADVYNRCEPLLPSTGSVAINWRPITQTQTLGINATRHHQSGKTAKRVLMPVINAKLPVVHLDVDPGNESRACCPAFANVSSPIKTLNFTALHPEFMTLQ